MKHTPLKQRKPLKRSKGTLAIRRDPMDDMFSECIRRKAIIKAGGCERCLCPKRDIQKDTGDIFPAWKQLECCHFDGRANKAVRWDMDNAAGLCFGCHKYLDSHALEKVYWFKQRIGEERFNMLLGRMRQTKPDIEAIGLYLNSELRELRMNDGD